MSEMGEMPPGVEVQKNPVVEGARKAVRGALETNESWRQHRDTLNVKPEGKSVYRAWVDAADKVVGAMTGADRNSLGTKLYEMKMRLAAGAFQISSATLDIAVNALSWIPRKGFMALGVVSLPFSPPAAAWLGGIGLAGEAAVRGGFTRKIGLRAAEFHERKRIWRYKMAETKEALKHGGDFIGERVKQVVTGFAYPEGKPVKPPMAKV